MFFSLISSNILCQTQKTFMREKEPYYFEKPDATRPLNKVERIGMRAYHLSMEYSGPGQNLKDPTAKAAFEQVLVDIANGNPFSHPLKDEKLKSYFEHGVNVSGQEHIPQTGSFVIISNHFNRGIHKGMPQAPIMAHAVSEHLPDGETRNFIPVIENEKRLVEKTEKNTRLNLVYPHLTPPISQSIHASVEKVVGQANDVANQVLFNTSVVFGMIPTNTHSREIPKVFRNGDVLILYPTGKDEFELHQVDPMAGKLAELAGAMRVPMLPIGFWFNRAKSTYQMRIGQSFTISRDKNNPESNINNADILGVQIAKLLPERMRGVYAQCVTD